MSARYLDKLIFSNKLNIFFWNERNTFLHKNKKNADFVVSIQKDASDANAAVGRDEQGLEMSWAVGTLY